MKTLIKPFLHLTVYWKNVFFQCSFEKETAIFLIIQKHPVNHPERCNQYCASDVARERGPISTAGKIVHLDTQGGYRFSLFCHNFLSPI